MDKEITKKFIENNGFICTQCGSVIVDGYNHENEEDLCEQCKIKKIKDLEYQLADHDKKVRAEVVAESEVLKARWEKLKTLVNDFEKEYVSIAPAFLLEKIKELEE